MVCFFLGICPFYLSYLICCRLVVHSFPYKPFYFSNVGSNVPAFIPDFSNFCFLFFREEVSMAKSLPFFFPQGTNLVSLIFFLYFSVFYFIELCSILYYFLPSTRFGFILLLPSVNAIALKCFFSVGIYNYKFRREWGLFWSWTFNSLIGTNC